MLKKKRKGGLRVLNPLDNKRNEVLLEIMQQNPIEDPINKFNLVIRE